MMVLGEHFVKQEARVMGSMEIIFHKIIELNNGIFLMEKWNKGNVNYIPYSEEQFKKMNNGEFAGVL